MTIPLRLEPYLSPRLWGGDRLEPFLGLPLLARDEPLGESWQVYAENRVVNGPDAGKTLAELAARDGAALLGTVPTARYGPRVPLLAKFIDAGRKLSIQVHPDDAYARQHEAASGHLGKAEAWYVLEATPGAEIIWGFKDDMSRDEVRAAVEGERLEPHLNHVAVRPGDVIYNPPGTVHAIGAGILLFEIQQSSDLTYRLYDYGRRDASGNLRDLHIAKALDVADLAPGERAKVTPRPLSEHRTELVHTRHFAAERWRLVGTERAQVDPTSLEILSLTEGELTMSAGGVSLTLARGESVVLPASLGDYQISGEATLLRSYVPTSP
ncbi:MAG: type I phosphomannose isomerase catalytic subunit [Trueperaceae bacterium]|nr:type I phosphomannose isomerase catalytic subunit [Trueperaceae bacterium]